MFTFCHHSLANSVQYIKSKYNLTHLIGNVDIYLYGHRNIGESDNKHLLLATIKYIYETGRFL